MGGSQIQYLIAIILYITAVIVIGVYYAKRASESSSNYLIGGRSLGPWITAMGAEASDMSGWLLMGLPGVAYWIGLGEAFWTALGLAIGTYLNWRIVAKRLRVYSHVANDSITIPDFLSNRYKEKRKVILTVAALFILVFFCVYAASCFVTVGKVFSALFDVEYQYIMIAGAVFVVLYTFVGGFLAESASDFMQGVVMIIALSVVLIAGVSHAGGISNVVENAKSIPGFFEFFGVATPSVDEAGKQIVENGKPLFGAPGEYGFLTILSTLAWGLGYFGMPQVLLKFMAIRKSSEIKISRIIAIIWVVISLGAAVFIGILGRMLYPASLLTQDSSENVFIILSENFFPPILASVVIAGILAATISSSDSYLLIAASAFSKNIYQGLFKKNASDKTILNISRITVVVIALIAMVIASDKESIIFKIVSFAWAGFGATFGPIMLFSLFWKRTTRMGAIAGMVSGGVMVFVWKLFVRPLGGVFDIYELLPAFVISCVVIVAVSLLTKPESEEVLNEFELVKSVKEI